jgi:predicted membrane protein
MNSGHNQGFDPFVPKLKVRLDEAEADAGAEAQASKHSRPAFAQGGVITAVIMITVGVVLLLHQLGIVPRQFIPHFVPTIFMLAGILLAANTSTANVGVFYAVSKRSKRAIKSPPANLFWGGALFVVGLIMELNARGITRVGLEIFWPLLIITTGAYMLWRHARGGARLTETITRSGYPFDLNFIFSGTDRQISDKDFKGGRINAIFGGFKLDFSHADIQSEQALLEVNAVFGGGEIRVPENWDVVLMGSGVFGGVEDKTRRYASDPSQTKKRLIIKSAAVFGGFTVSN